LVGRKRKSRKTQAYANSEDYVVVWEGILETSRGNLTGSQLEGGKTRVNLLEETRLTGEGGGSSRKKTQKDKDT